MSLLRTLLQWVVHNARRAVGFYQVQDSLVSLQKRIDHFNIMLTRIESDAVNGNMVVLEKFKKLEDWMERHSAVLENLRTEQAKAMADLALVKDISVAAPQIASGMNVLLQQSGISQTALAEIATGVRKQLAGSTIQKETLAVNQAHLQSRFNGVEHNISEIILITRQLAELIPLEELHYRDLMLQADGKITLPPVVPMRIETARPIAADSNDHLHPRGTRNDNTRWPRFVHACEKHFPNKKLTFLDLGCAGGGLVLDFLLRGHEAAGVEGSDYSLRAQRAEWRLLAESRLFTADITHPFQLYAPDGNSYKANIVSAWEFLEHMNVEDLPSVFANVITHLAPEGYFIGSISLIQDVGENGTVYHHTVRPREWWADTFAKYHCPMITTHHFDFLDFCRGVGNGKYDQDFHLNPQNGFHFVASIDTDYYVDRI